MFEIEPFFLYIMQSMRDFPQDNIDRYSVAYDTIMIVFFLLLLHVKTLLWTSIMGCIQGVYSTFNLLYKVHKAHESVTLSTQLQLLWGLVFYTWGKWCKVLKVIGIPIKICVFGQTPSPAGGSPLQHNTAGHLKRTWPYGVFRPPHWSADPVSAGYLLSEMLLLICIQTEPLFRALVKLLTLFQLCFNGLASLKERW